MESSERQDAEPFLAMEARALQHVADKMGSGRAAAAVAANKHMPVVIQHFLEPGDGAVYLGGVNFLNSVK